MNNSINTFSSAFLEEFRTNFPEYSEYTENLEISSKGEITFIIPSPTVEDLKILISTELNDIILSFDGWHCHLYDENEKDMEKSFSELRGKINSIINEEVICCVYKTVLLKKHKQVLIDEFKKLKSKNKILSSYSWHGTYNYNL